MKEELQHLLLDKKHNILQYFLPIIPIAFLLICILGLMVVNTDKLNKQIEDNTIKYADDVSAQLASDISSRMQMRQTYITNLADTFAETDISLINKKLLDRKAEYLEMEEIFVVNSDGSTIPSNKENPDLTNYISENKEVFNQPKIFVTKHDEVLYVAPIKRQNGQVSLLIGVRTQELFQSMLKDVNFKQQGISCIVDSHGSVIVSATNEAPFLELVDIFKKDKNSKDGQEAQKVLDDINSNKSGTVQFESVNNETIILGYDFLGINDWILLTLVPSDLFSRETEVYMVRYGIIVGVTAIVMLLILVTIVSFYQRSLKKIQTAALTDPLTDGPNFLSFQIDGKSILLGHPSLRFAIVYLNIRNFKRYNVRYGVEYGDKLLVSLYKILDRCLGENELMARTTGDQFYMMIRCKDSEDVCNRMDSILDSIEEQLSDDFSLSRKNFIQGAYIIREKDVEFLVLTDRAKTASMYQDGTSECHFYDDKLDKRINQEHILDDAFQRALENREFKLYIQPKVKPGQKNADSGEVLVRWDYPGYGLIYPGDFIPVFERSGKICDLDFYMFEETCRLLSKWLDEGMAVPLSVNLSRAHLHSNDLSFLDRFKEIKEKYNIPNGYIELELTESLMLERWEIGLVVTMIDKIREMGMFCSIDDFGFGHSSLTMLKDLNVTTVKLDRQFFTTETKKARTVVQQLIHLAHNLNMTVVAEGIETYDHVELLQLYDCDLIQGYVYAKPMPVSEFEVWEDKVKRPERKMIKQSTGCILANQNIFIDSPDAGALCEGNNYKNRLNVALKAAKISVYEVDLINQQFTFYENSEAIFGISPKEILHNVQAFSSLPSLEYQKALANYFAHPDDQIKMINSYNKILDGQTVSYSARMHVKGGSYIWCKNDVTPIMEDGRPVRVIGIITDISDMRRKRELLEHKINLDGFTGLWNKSTSFAMIKDVLEQEPEGRHALLLADIDKFKNFNDTYGHLLGDEVIAATARHYENIFNDGSIVGRFGGDEFIVFVRNVSNVKLLEEQARQMTRIEDEAYSSTSSVGISLYPDDGTNFEELFEEADKALYRAKKKRCDIVFATGTSPSEEA